MNKVKMYMLLFASFSLLFIGCSNKTSDEACLHETTMNLDKGNYDGVLNSPCASAMQRGAAYFGKAGFDVTNVIKKFSETNNSSGGNAFATFMDKLVGKVDDTTLSYMGKSEIEYTKIKDNNPPTSDSYKDAKFYIGIVDAVKSLTLLKAITDIGGEGAFNKECDRNINSNPDGLDTAACALQASVDPNLVCSIPGASVTNPNSGNITLTNISTGNTYTSGNFRGLNVSVTGSGPNAEPCPTQSQYILYQVPPATAWALVTTASGTLNCIDNNGIKWPCPMLSENDSPMPLVSAVDTNLNAAIINMSTGQTTTSDVLKSIEDIKKNACPSGTCTEGDIASYLQTYGTGTVNLGTTK